ncbi:molybdenum cofactor biosynthesis protein [Candidatus Aerophobetes bacterium]|uniref:Molybdenum cofactor biosynthesis protein B n=1 Tax=Aerophobetes bacterium TaxID=2030807 RepID=A0A662DEM1_UNCAE|nr:MAG: molybdenum cofactor biosynthesis protein [Candidatus Aerophobetes bacterium]
MKIGIITVSDSCFEGKREDKSGKTVQQMVASLGRIVEYRIVPDEKKPLRLALLDLIDKKQVDLLLTTGGTGISPRDITPEVTEELVEKRIPGLGELMRMKTFSSSRTSVLSRAIAGVRGKTLVVNLPGSPRGAKECLGILLPILSHAVDMIRGLPHDEQD